MKQLAGTLLAFHGAGTSVSRPLLDRAHRMQAPGVPHAILVPLAEIAAGAALATRGTPANTAAAAAAATALGAVRVGSDFEDQTITAGTVAAAALSVTGVRAATTTTRGAARVLLLAATGAVIVFELTRRRRIRSAGRRIAFPSPVKGTCPKMTSRRRASRSTKPRTVVRILLGAAMTWAGISHLTVARQEFRAQVPEFVPLDPDVTVLASGIAEISLGAALMLLVRRQATVGWVAAVFFTAIFPGNIAQWMHHRDGFGLDTDTKRFVRLLFQPVLIAVALWATNALRKRR